MRHALGTSPATSARCHSVLLCSPLVYLPCTAYFAFQESHQEVGEVRAEREHLEAEQVKLMEDMKNIEVVMQKLKLSPRVILEQRNKLQEAVNAALEAYKVKQGSLADVKARLRSAPSPAPPAVPCAAAPSTAAPSLLAAPQILHQSSPHHAALAGQACASRSQACCHESSSSSEEDSTSSSGEGSSREGCNDVE
eukprot:881432-Pelagomonas_calceolata.AAC.8